MNGSPSVKLAGDGSGVHWTQSRETIDHRTVERLSQTHTMSSLKKPQSGWMIYNHLPPLQALDLPSQTAFLPFSLWALSLARICSHSLEQSLWKTCIGATTMSHFGRAGPPDIRDTYSLLVLNITFRMYPILPFFVCWVFVTLPDSRFLGFRVCQSSGAHFCMQF